MKPADPATNRTSARPSWTSAALLPRAIESRPISPRPMPPASNTSRNTTARMSHLPDVRLGGGHRRVEDEGDQGDGRDRADHDERAPSGRGSVWASVDEREESKRAEQE